MGPPVFPGVLLDSCIDDDVDDESFEETIVSDLSEDSKIFDKFVVCKVSPFLLTGSSRSSLGKIISSEVYAIRGDHTFSVFEEDHFEVG